MPLLSIIIPTYNAQETIVRSISSAFGQSFRDWEILIIDGKSIDETVKVISRFAHQDNRIKFISEPDKGIYDAMNKGIGLASGQWIYFLGSDDTLMPDILVPVADTLKTTSSDVIYGNVQSTRFGGKYDGAFDVNKILVKNICHQAIFFRKTVFEKTGLFNLRYRAHADWDHNMKWLLDKDIKKEYIDLVVAEYADGGFSSTNGDPAFAKDRTFKYLIYGTNTLKKETKIQLSRNQFKTAIISRNLRNALRFGSYWFSSLIHAKSHGNNPKL